MSAPTVLELVVAAAGLALFVISAWKLASWLARRGHVIRPATWMDHQMTKIESAAAEKKRAEGSPDRD